MSQDSEPMENWTETHRKDFFAVSCFIFKINSHFIFLYIISIFTSFLKQHFNYQWSNWYSRKNTLVLSEFKNALRESLPWNWSTCSLSSCRDLSFPEGLFPKLGSDLPWGIKAVAIKGDWLQQAQGRAGKKPNAALWNNGAQRGRGRSAEPVEAVWPFPSARKGLPVLICSVCQLPWCKHSWLT
jgi:hypothetical protein